jgi:chromosome segregation ATPase
MADFQSRHLGEIEGRTKDRTVEIADLEREIAAGQIERKETAAEIEKLGAEIGSVRTEAAEKDAALAALRRDAVAADDALRRFDTELQDLTRRQLDIQRRMAQSEADQRRWNDEAQRLKARAATVGRGDGRGRARRG